MIVGALAIFGILLIVGGLLLTLVRAFQTSVGWGVSCLLFPVVRIPFLMCHWERAKGSFFCTLLGVGLIGAAAWISGPNTKNENFVIALINKWGSEEKGDADSLTTQIQETRSRIETLEGQFHVQGTDLAKQFQALDKRRKELKVNDVAEIQRFNVEAGAYTAKNASHKALVAELDSARKELQRLLDERSTLRANSAPAEVPVEAPSPVVASNHNAPAKEIIMYTTSRCPACVAAKTYMARKGIRYDERDVERSSSAAAEFRKLGGRGVPLIMVGNQRMSGFNARELERMIGS